MNAHSDKIDRVQFVTILILQASLVAAIIAAAIVQQYNILFVSLTIFILTFIPMIIERRFKIDLPVEMEFFIILFIYASLYLGEIHGYYTRYWWWDILIHTGSGFALGFVGFLILYTMYNRRVINGKPLLLVIFAFSFALAIGALWEIFEFGMDQIFARNMQTSGLVDTMWDLIVDSIGALIVSIAGYFHLKNGRNPLLGRIMTKFFNKKNK